MRDIAIAMEQAKVYRGAKLVLDIENLHIAKGELLSILGANGSGKSTLLQVLNGLLPYGQGTVTVLGTDLSSSDRVELRRRSSLVFQEPQFIHDTVYANVSLPLRFRGLPANVVEDRVTAAMEAFRCGHLRQRLAHRLSGGEAQRVCLARAFVTEPELLLLDEPFSALDPATRNTLLAELKEASLAKGITTILVSHNLEEVMRFAQRALVFEKGRIVQDTMPEAVMRRPARLSVARLVNIDNIWPCRVTAGGSGRTVQLAGNIFFPVAEAGGEGQGYCCLPGDAFRLLADADSQQAALIGLNMRVKQIIPGIGVSQVEAEGDGLSAVLRLSAETAGSLRADADIQVAFRSADAHILMA